MRQLNTEQARAVRHFTGPMLVLAGPGSGKTFTLVERIRYLIEARNVSPGSILTITFSKKAAVEMQTRFYDLIGDKHYPVTFGTFHSIFYNILRTYHNYTTDSILTPNDKIKYMKRTLKKLSIDATESEDFVIEMLSKISAYKSFAGCEGIAPNYQTKINTTKNNYAKTTAATYYNTQAAVENTETKEQKFFADNFEDESKAAEFLKIYETYEKDCRINGKLDFDDMITLCYKLLKENKAALKKWQGIFKYFLVDEFQDINDIQYEILMLLAGDERNIFAVGDDDQSIYGFRGSKPALMRRFLKLDNCQITDMYKNYRCAEDVITAAGCLIANNKERIVKNQISCKDDKEGTVYTATFISEKEEAEFIIKKLTELQSADGKMESTAILYRTERCAAFLEEKLKASGIKYSKAVKKGGFYAEDWVKDIIAYLKVGIGEYETSDIYRILNKPDRGISREEVRNFNPDNSSQVESSLHNSNPQILKTPTSAASSPQQYELSYLIEDISFIENLSCFAAVNYIFKGLGYYKYLLKQNAKSGHDKAYTDEMAEDLIMRARDFNNIREWLEYIENLSDGTENADNQAINKQTTGDNPISQTPKNTGNTTTADATLVLQTAHSSKGLEYENVFVIGLMEGLFPHHKAKSEGEIEEERRLMYVAMTRAKRTLYVLGRGEVSHGKRISRFVDEVKNCGKTVDIEV